MYVREKYEMCPEEFKKIYNNWTNVHLSLIILGLNSRGTLYPKVGLHKNMMHLINQLDNTC